MRIEILTEFARIVNAQYYCYSCTHYKDLHLRICCFNVSWHREIVRFCFQTAGSGKPDGPAQPKSQYDIQYDAWPVYSFRRLFWRNDITVWGNFSIHIPLLKALSVYYEV